MMNPTRNATFALLAALCATPALPQSAGPYYEEDPAASNPIRTGQARELDTYIRRLKGDPSRLRSRRGCSSASSTPR